MSVKDTSAKLRPAHGGYPGEVSELPRDLPSNRDAVGHGGRRRDFMHSVEESIVEDVLASQPFDYESSTAWTRQAQADSMSDEEIEAELQRLGEVDPFDTSQRLRWHSSLRAAQAVRATAGSHRAATGHILRNDRGMG